MMLSSGYLPMFPGYLPIFENPASRNGGNQLITNLLPIDYLHDGICYLSALRRTATS